MRQLLYVSLSTTPPQETPLLAILEQSRHHNALDGITGLLWSDGARFAQVLEGDEAAIRDAMVRIRSDKRHRDVQIVHDIFIDEREFGEWSMDAHTPAGADDIYNNRMRRALASAGERIREMFSSLTDAGNDRAPA